MTGAAGPFAGAIESLWWFTFVLFTAVFIAVMTGLAWATWRRRRAGAPTEQQLTFGVSAAVGATVVILLIYLVADLVAARAIVHGGDPADALHVRVTGHQWWWEIEYLDPVPARRLLTANELHIPVGRDVRISTRSADVIHSFWVPKLAGKRDLIPGDSAFIWIRADEPGEYRGICSEFCGHQHAHMGLVVVAEPESRFATWYEQQLQPARPPQDPLAVAGLDVFMNRSCVLCHAIRGTPAAARVAPDLTHIASRRTLAAGTVANTRGNMGGWIMDPHTIKPGVKMPPTALSSHELLALLAYLETLR